MFFNVKKWVGISEMKNMIVEMKFSINGLNSRVAIAEGKICNLKTRAAHKGKEPGNAKEI